MPYPRTARTWLFALAPLLPLCLPAAALAEGEVAGPIEVGPSWGTADAAHSSATLQTVLVNHGDLADRVIRAECPASGQVALTNATQHRDVMGPNAAQEREGAAQRGAQNGLDLPPALDGKPQPVTASFALTQAKQPLTDGVHVPCALYFARNGERIVLFTLGAQPQATAEP